MSDRDRGRGLFVKPLTLLVNQQADLYILDEIVRVAKYHGYDGYIHVRIFAFWGKNIE